MCKQCIDAARKYFPGISDSDVIDLLWENTSYPAGDARHIEKHLRRLSKRSRGNLVRARWIDHYSQDREYARMKRHKAEAHNA